jgi:PhnB protein
MSFNGNARDAMEFYKSVFGGNLTMSTFKEFQVSQGPSMDNLIMHAELEAENGIKFMAADTPEGMKYKPGESVRMALSGEDKVELSGYFEKLSKGGLITQPLEKAPWGDSFGMVVDKFGITWFVNIITQKA